jgi:hypothetical protein
MKSLRDNFNFRQPEVDEVQRYQIPPANTLGETASSTGFDQARELGEELLRALRQSGRCRSLWHFQKGNGFDQLRSRRSPLLLRLVLFWGI